MKQSLRKWKDLVACLPHCRAKHEIHAPADSTQYRSRHGYQDTEGEDTLNLSTERSRLASTSDLTLSQCPSSQVLGGSTSAGAIGNVRPKDGELRRPGGPLQPHDPVNVQRQALRIAV